MKYQVFGPNGRKVCILDVYLISYTDTHILIEVIIKSKSQHRYVKLPLTWALICFDCMTDGEIN